MNESSKLVMAEITQARCLRWAGFNQFEGGFYNASPQVPLVENFYASLSTGDSPWMNPLPPTHVAYLEIKSPYWQAERVEKATQKLSHSYLKAGINFGKLTRQ